MYAVFGHDGSGIMMRMMDGPLAMQFFSHDEAIEAIRTHGAVDVTYFILLIAQ